MILVRSLHSRLVVKVLLFQISIDKYDLQKEKGGLGQEPSQKKQNLRFFYGKRLISFH
jgi:hypothetical protein